MSSEPSKIEREASQVPANPKEDLDIVHPVSPLQEEESVEHENQQPELIGGDGIACRPDAPSLYPEGIRQCASGNGKKVVDNWERETEFRRYINKQTQVVIPRRGQIFGFIIVVLALGVSVCAIILGNTWQGLGFFLATLVSAVSAMIWGRKS